MIDWLVIGALFVLAASSATLFAIATEIAAYHFSFNASSSAGLP